MDTKDAHRKTLRELIERYEAHVLPTKPKSQKKQSSQLKWWKAHYGSLLLMQVTSRILAEARDKLASEHTNRGKKRSPATVNRYLAVMSHALSIATKEWGWIAANPMARIRKPSEPKGRVRWLDDDERRRLLLACQESRTRLLYPIVLLALSTGMRKSEIMRLQWSDVDLAGKLTLQASKNGERRAVTFAVEPWMP